MTSPDQRPDQRPDPADGPDVGPAGPVASGAPEPASEVGYVPPELPPVKAGLAHIVIPGTVLWFVAWVVLLFFLDELRAHDATIWLSTCLAGWVLGLMGLSIYAWQRSAARRGRRSANQMALDEQL